MTCRVVLAVFFARQRGHPTDALILLHELIFGFRPSNWRGHLKESKPVKRGTRYRIRYVW